MPAISIITALHNKEPYVAETILSVLAQSVSDWELIVVENGSTDNGVDIVRKFVDRRISLVTSSKVGPGAARNFGLKMASGDWVLFLDADDIIESTYLEKRLLTAKLHPRADIVCGPWREFCDSNTTNVQLRLPTRSCRNGEVWTTASIAYAPWALHAAIVKRSSFASEGWWPEPLDQLPSEDAAFWFRLLQTASVATSDDAGALYRVNTPNSRDAVNDVVRRAHGLLSVVEHNRALLMSRGLEPTAEQRAHVVRVLEGAYCVARSRGQQETAKLLLQSASFWLRGGEPKGVGMCLRRILGVRLFNLLRSGAI